MSVVDYFREQYNYSLRYTNLPCLQAGSDNRPIYLPMEVVSVFICHLSFKGCYMYLGLVFFSASINLVLSFGIEFIVICSLQVCSIVEGQRYSRKLNERQVSGILKMACERPAQREKSVLDVI
jgi:eukaryotic translation initiation factor 2C